MNVLHKWIATYAHETDQLPERVIRQVSYMVAAQALERARDEHGAPLFLIKGGVMIELRLGLRARATKDLDAVFRARFDALLDQLDDAISQPIGGFTLARTEPEEIKQTSTQRLQLVIDCRGRRWAQVPLEVAPVEAPDVLEIERVEPLRVSQLGVPEPESVPVVAPAYQIAQKLHACTERFMTGPDNDRFPRPDGPPAAARLAHRGGPPSRASCMRMNLRVPRQASLAADGDGVRVLA